MRVGRVRHAQLVPPAGAVRKPKYVESPRVPGEAALGAQRRPEPGEPSASGECMPGPAASPAWGGGPSVLGAGAAGSARSSQLSPCCPALPGKEDPLCWEQALQPLHGPHSCLLLRLAMVCLQALLSQGPPLPHRATPFWPFPELLSYYQLSPMCSFAFFAVLRFRNLVKVC